MSTYFEKMMHPGSTAFMASQDQFLSSILHGLDSIFSEVEGFDQHPATAVCGGEEVDLLEVK
jgi:hypothetical protein